MLFIIIGLALVSVVLDILSMGGNFNPKQAEINSSANKTIGFPIQLVENKFPLLLSNNEFWSTKNLILVLINTLIQSILIYYFVTYFKKTIK